MESSTDTGNQSEVADDTAKVPNKNNLADIGLGALTSPRRYRRLPAANKRSPLPSPRVLFYPALNETGDDSHPKLAHHSHPLIPQPGLEPVDEELGDNSDLDSIRENRDLPAPFATKTQEDRTKVDGDGSEEDDNRGSCDDPPGDDDDIEKLKARYEEVLVRNAKLRIGKQEIEKQIKFVEANFEAQNTYLLSLQNSLDTEKLSAKSMREAALAAKKKFDRELAQAQERVTELESDIATRDNTIVNYKKQERSIQSAIQKAVKQVKDEKRVLERAFERRERRVKWLEEQFHASQNECKRVYGEVERCHAWMEKTFEQHARRDQAQLRLYDERLLKLMEHPPSAAIRDSFPPSYAEHESLSDFVDSTTSNPPSRPASFLNQNQEFAREPGIVKHGHVPATEMTMFDESRALTGATNHTFSRKLPELAFARHAAPTPASQASPLSFHANEKLSSKPKPSRMSLSINIQDLLTKKSLTGRALSMPFTRQEHAELQDFMKLLLYPPVPLENSQIMSIVAGDSDFAPACREGTANESASTSVLDGEGERINVDDTPIHSTNGSEVERQTLDGIPPVTTGSPKIVNRTENRESHNAIELVKEQSGSSSSVEYPPSPGLRKRTATFPKEAPLRTRENPNRAEELRSSTHIVSSAGRKNEYLLALAESIKRLAAYAIFIVNTRASRDQLANVTPFSGAFTGRPRYGSEQLGIVKASWVGPSVRLLERSYSQSGNRNSAQSETTEPSSDSMSGFATKSDRTSQDTMDTQYSDGSVKSDTVQEHDLPADPEKTASAGSSATDYLSSSTEDIPRESFPVTEDGSQTGPELDGLILARVPESPSSSPDNASLPESQEAGLDDPGNMIPTNLYNSNRVPIYKRRNGNLSNPALQIVHHLKSPGPPVLATAILLTSRQFKDATDTIQDGIGDSSSSLGSDPEDVKMVEAVNLPAAGDRSGCEPGDGSPESGTEFDIKQQISLSPRLLGKPPTPPRKDYRGPLHPFQSPGPLWLALASIFFVLGAMICYWATVKLIEDPQCPSQACIPCQIPYPDVEPYERTPPQTATIYLISTQVHKTTVTQTDTKITTQSNPSTSTLTQTKTVYTAVSPPPSARYAITSIVHGVSTPKHTSASTIEQVFQGIYFDNSAQFCLPQDRSLLNCSYPYSSPWQTRMSTVRLYEPIPCADARTPALERVYVRPSHWGFSPWIQYLIDILVFDFKVWFPAPGLGQKIY